MLNANFRYAQNMIAHHVVKLLHPLGMRKNKQTQNIREKIIDCTLRHNLAM
jgi:hypothetical protein